MPSAVLPPRLAAWLLATALPLAAAPDAHATPPGAARAASPSAPVRRVPPPSPARPAPASVRRPPAVPRAAPAPPVVLQLTGLRVMAPLPHAAVLHALARDAWPFLLR